MVCRKEASRGANQWLFLRYCVFDHLILINRIIINITFLRDMSCASYGYNSRGEVISVIAENDPAYNFAYTFDVIGNRISSQENTATQTVAECGYDSQGRRIEKRVTVAGTVVLHERYVYDGYLQIAAFDVSTDASGTEFSSLKRSVLWDPVEATATRPLVLKNFL